MKIVFVGVTSAHRSMAFDAAEFIMDYLKNPRPRSGSVKPPDRGERWVDARDSDRQAAKRW
ncbi:molybdenum cofactor biosynthesis protein MoaE [Serratia odorifera]|uniref:molybdenum cofactor biosynthesis protein MoaE n=1 Tax=Serratia odorifera TaxID=618 RepID=UPI0030CD3C51